MFFFFSSRRRHTRSKRDWSSDVCSSDLAALEDVAQRPTIRDHHVEARVWQCPQITDIQFAVRLHAARKPPFRAIAMIELQLDVGDVGDNDAAAEAVERLSEASGACADFQYARPARHKPLEIEIVDVLMYAAQRRTIKAMPFAVSELVEVALNCRGIVGHRGRTLIGFENRFDEAQALRFHPRFGHRGNTDRAETISGPGRRPALPGGVLHFALDEDAVPRVVAEDERRGEPAARREGQSNAGVRVIALDVL